MAHSGTAFVVSDPKIEKDIDGKQFGEAPTWSIGKASDGAVALKTEEGWYMQGGEVDCTLGLYRLTPQAIVEDVEAERLIVSGAHNDSGCHLRQ